MVSAVKVQPLSSFRGVMHQLELFPNQIVVRRCDPLASFAPSLFGDTRVIDLTQLAGIYLHESRYVYNRWAMLTLILANHRKITVLYERKHYNQAEAFKNAVDDFLSKREPYPEAK